MDPLWQQINNAIHRRHTESVYELIPTYLKANRSSAKSLYEASEFYRKIGDYPNAMRVLPKERRKVNSDTSDDEIKLELQLARLLNILGASNYALRMVDRIRAEKRAKSKIEIVEIYHCNNLYSKVIETIGADFPMPEAEAWHQDWLLHYYFANAQSGLGQTEPAIGRMRKVRELTDSPLIRAIALCYEGKFLVRAGNLKEALKALQESQKFFGNNDKTSDHAILQMWLGACLLKLEKYSDAATALEKALRVFYMPAYKPEDWMEIVLLLEQIPGYCKSEQRLAPRLRAMRGPDYSPLRVLASQEPETEGSIFSVSKMERSKKTIHFDRTSDVAWSAKKARLGLDMVDELIWNLIYAGKYGLPQYMLYEMLWPDESFSFDQHQKRLENLVIRARKQEFKIEWQDLHLRLGSTNVSVTDRPKEVIRGHCFLQKHLDFSRRDVEMYFAISTTNAWALCRDWLKLGIAIPSEKGRYQAVFSEN